MVTGLNYFYDLLGIRKDIFNIYYDFNNTTGATLLPSVSGGNYLHSGQINGGLTVSNSSGFFNGSNFVKVSNTNLITGKNWSHFFVYEKTGTQTGLLFSSLNNNSGYEIGINRANRLYFKFNTGAPSYYTFDQILANRNAVGISLSDSYLEFDHYNFNTKRFESESFVLPANLLFTSNDWKIGQGFLGTIDDYAFFNGNISKSNRERLFSGFHSLLDLTSGSSLFVTGYTRYQTGVVSGNFKVYNSGFIFYTGNLSYSNNLVSIDNSNNLQFFGDITDDCGRVKTLYRYNENTGVLSTDKLLKLTGNLYQSYHNSAYYTENNVLSGIEITGYSENSISLFSGVTGVDIIENVNVIDNCGNVEVLYTYNNLTGIISGIEFLPLTGLILNYDNRIDNYYLGQFVILGATINSPRVSDARRVVPFGYNAVTYLWDYQPEETLEIVTFPDTLDITNIDKQAGFDTVRSASVLDSRYSSGVLNLWLNGQLQQESGRYVTGTVYSQQLVWEGDYFLDANLAYGSGYEITDSVFYDYIASNVKGFKRVTGIGTYPLAVGSPYNKNFFLNGQKIYTGNYILNGNNITLTGGLESITGNLIFVDKYPNESNITGVETIVTNRFPKETSFIYQNGIKISDTWFVEHCNLDKISGANIYFENGKYLYNNEGIFWE